MATEILLLRLPVEEAPTIGQLDVVTPAAQLMKSSAEMDVP